MKTHATRIENTLINHKSRQLAEAIQRGIDSWMEAGKLLVSMLDHEGMSLAQIADEADSDFITPEVLAQFERIGRGQVLPALLAAQYPAAKYLERLPMSLQTQSIRDGVELLIVKAGKTDSLNVAVKHLTQKQCKQVFDRNGIRSLAYQRAWLEEQNMNAERGTIKGTSNPWSVKGNEVIVSKPCILNKANILQMLQQLR